MAKFRPLADDDLAWVAGVLDLKGVVVRKKNKLRATPQVCLYVETKNYDVICALSELTGTAPELHERITKEFMRRGCVDHCPEGHVHVAEHDWEWSMPAISRWTVTGAAAAVVLYNTVPRMRTNNGLRKVMDELLDQSVMAGRGWGATRSAIRRLRDLGWELPPQYDVLDLDG